jgi:hypothetical protein
MTPLDKNLKRALKIKGRDYVLHLTPDSLKITEKGRRLGVELNWQELVSGETALAVALHASVGKFSTESRSITEKPKKPKRPLAPQKIALRPRPMPKRSPLRHSR